MDNTKKKIITNLIILFFIAGGIVYGYAALKNGNEEVKEQQVQEKKGEIKEVVQEKGEISLDVPLKSEKDILEERRDLSVQDVLIDSFVDGAVFWLTWSSIGNNAVPDLQLLTPSGMIIDKAYAKYSERYVDQTKVIEYRENMDSKFAWYHVPAPERGIWKVFYSNKVADPILNIPLESSVEARLSSVWREEEYISGGEPLDFLYGVRTGEALRAVYTVTGSLTDVTMSGVLLREPLESGVVKKISDVVFEKGEKIGEFTAHILPCKPGIYVINGKIGGMYGQEKISRSYSTQIAVVGGDSLQNCN